MDKKPFIPHPQSQANGSKRARPKHLHLRCNTSRVLSDASNYINQGKTERKYHAPSPISARPRFDSVERSRGDSSPAADHSMIQDDEPDPFILLDGAEYLKQVKAGLEIIQKAMANEKRQNASLLIQNQILKKENQTLRKTLSINGIEDPSDLDTARGKIPDHKRNNSGMIHYNEILDTCPGDCTP